MLFLLAAGVLASGCASSSASAPTAPSATSSTQTAGAVAIGALSTGTWAADALPGGIILSPGTCGNFKWSVTTVTVGSATFTMTLTMQVGASGTFSADCGGGLSLAGNATASLNGANAVWTAAGNVTGSATCQFVVNGTATQENGGVRVTYNATVCGVTTTGSELLNKR
jgi:hypothetical protein